MPTSEARINANRINAQMSTGPRTTEGKERSRANGLKHGLTGAGIVLLEEDASEVELRAKALMAELDPRSTLGKILVGQLATLSVRMERGAKREEEALAGRVRHATEAFDHDRVDHVEFLFDTIADDPRGHLIELRRSPEGVDRLIEGWQELRGVLTRSSFDHDWDAPHQAMLGHLVGQRPDQAKGSRNDSLSMAVRYKPVTITDPDWTPLGIRERRAWARDRLVERIDLEIAGLEEHRRTLDIGAIELDRLGAADMALFDTSRDGTLARRYESEARRGFFKSLKELQKAEAEVKAVEEDRPVPVTAIEPIAEPEPAPLGSSCAGAPPSPRQPEPTDLEWPSLAPSTLDGAARGLDGRVIAIGRAAVLLQ